MKNSFLTLYILMLATPLYSGIEADLSISSKTSKNYLRRKKLRDDLIIKIEEATKKRCPYIKIGKKVIALCHGEERWRKSLDCDHQAIFKVSEFYHQSIKQNICNADNEFTEIKFKKDNKIHTIKREGIGIWLTEVEGKKHFETPLKTVHIDYNPLGEKSDFYTVILKPEARNKPICQVTSNDIIDVVRFHDPNCDLEIMTIDTPLINFVHLKDEDIFHIVSSIGTDRHQYQGCIQSFNHLLLLNNISCIVNKAEYKRKSKSGITELKPGKSFLKKIVANSSAGSPMDYSAGGRIAGSRHTFYIYDGKVYNYRDFGNFLWSLSYRLASCKKEKFCDGKKPIKCRPTIFNKIIALGGANYNAFFKTYKENIENSRGCSAAPIEGLEENTIILRGDSSPDQAAIKLGLTHSIGEYILERALPSYCRALRELNSE